MLIPEAASLTSALSDLLKFKRANVERKIWTVESGIAFYANTEITRR